MLQNCVLRILRRNASKISVYTSGQKNNNSQSTSDVLRVGVFCEEIPEIRIFQEIHPVINSNGGLAFDLYKKSMLEQSFKFDQRETALEEPDEIEANWITANFVAVGMALEKILEVREQFPGKFEEVEEIEVNTFNTYVYDTLEIHYETAKAMDWKKVDGTERKHRHLIQRVGETYDNMPENVSLKSISKTLDGTWPNVPAWVSADIAGGNITSSVREIFYTPVAYRILQNKDPEFPRSFKDLNEFTTYLEDFSVPQKIREWCVKRYLAVQEINNRVNNGPNIKDSFEDHVDAAAINAALASKKTAKKFQTKKVEHTEDVEVDDMDAVPIASDGAFKL